MQRTWWTRKRRRRRRRHSGRPKAAAAESLVETALELVTVECRRCFHTFAEGETHYDPSVNHSVCNDQEACTLRMPTGGRKRARPAGSYARLAAGR